MAQPGSFVRVLLLEPNATSRSAILSVLDSSHYDVDVCDSLDQVLVHASTHDTVALVAWQAMNGLLADEHRNHLLKLTNRLRLVIMVPRRWARLLVTTDLGGVVAGIVPKPFEADELVSAIRGAAAPHIAV